MANPQLEDGYTMIANEILDSLMLIELSANQWQVLLCIIRKTYGYKKKVDRIANFQVCEATGLRKDVVSRALHKLEEVRMIFRNGKMIDFQKNYQQWEFAEQQTKKLAELPTKLAKQPTKVGNPHGTQKKKETIQNKEGVEKIKIANKLPPRQDREVLKRLARDPLTRVYRDTDKDTDLIPLENITHKFSGSLHGVLTGIKKDIEGNRSKRAKKK